MRIIGLIFSKLVQGSVDDFESYADKNGVPESLSKVLKKYHTRIRIFKSPEVEEVLKNKPCILIANHPYIIDPIPLISALPKRENFSVLMYDFMVGVSGNLDKHIIPVYIKYHLSGKKLGFLKILANSLDKKPILTKQEEHQKNITSIGKASQEISAGGLVIIFPLPEMLKNSNHWFNGVGFLVDEIKNRDNVWILYANINGTSSYDILRMIPVVNLFMPTIKIKFSSPLKLNALLPSKIDPREVTTLLEKSYYEWK